MLQEILIFPSHDSPGAALICALLRYFPSNNAGRHSLGMALSKAGVDMSQISAPLRHSNAAATKKHYAEPDMGVLKKVVDNVRAMK
jgi:hypothetical protein